MAAPFHFSTRTSTRSSTTKHRSRRSASPVQQPYTRSTPHVSHSQKPTFDLDELEENDALYREQRQLRRRSRHSRPASSRTNSTDLRNSWIEPSTPPKVTLRRPSIHRQSTEDEMIKPLSERIRTLDSEDDWESDFKSLTLQPRRPSPELRGDLSSACGNLQTQLMACVTACRKRIDTNEEVIVRIAASIIEDASDRVEIWAHEVDIKAFDDAAENQGGRLRSLASTALINLTKSVGVLHNKIETLPPQLPPSRRPTEKELDQAEGAESSEDEDTADMSSDPTYEIEQLLRSVNLNLRTLRRLARNVKSQHDGSAAVVATHVAEVQKYFGTAELCEKYAKPGRPPHAVLKEAKAMEV